jgi:putative salt-induced outer membrane protein YdiY
MNLLLLLGLPAWAHVDVSNNGYWTRRTPENFSVISLDDQQVFERRAPQKGVSFQRPESRLDLEAGGTSAMGNVGTSVLFSRFYGEHRWKVHRLSVKGRAEYGQSIVDQNGDGTIDDFERDAGFERTSQHFDFDARYDRYLSRLTSSYALAGWMNDPFTGYLQRIHAQTGLSQFVVAMDEHEVVGETGFDVARERYVPEVELDEDLVYSARGFLGWTAQVSESFEVDQSVESFLNVEDRSDMRIIGEVALSMKATNLLSVRTSYLVEHATMPIDGFRKTDQGMAFTVVATLQGKGSR